VPPIALRRRGAGRLVALAVCCAFVLVPAVAQARAAAPLPTIINPLLFSSVMAQDVPSRTAREMATHQGPATLAVAAGTSGVPAWRSIPSWYMVAHDDRAIPPAAERFMARRAHATTVEIASSHAAPPGHPAEVASFIRTVARAAG
jgi:pimeloyl-ACP methyl ester carboxylesterase